MDACILQFGALLEGKYAGFMQIGQHSRLYVQAPAAAEQATSVAASKVTVPSPVEGTGAKSWTNAVSPRLQLSC